MRGCENEPQWAAECYNSLRKFIGATAEVRRARNELPAKNKITTLENPQFQELCIDFSDEMRRREMNGEDRWLLPHPEYPTRRNEGRRKLSTLTDARFTELAIDVYFELEGRFPQLRVNVPLSSPCATEKSITLDALMRDLGSITVHESTQPHVRRSTDLLVQLETAVATLTEAQEQLKVACAERDEKNAELEKLISEFNRLKQENEADKQTIGALNLQMANLKQQINGNAVIEQSQQDKSKPPARVSEEMIQEYVRAETWGSELMRNFNNALAVMQHVVQTRPLSEAVDPLRILVERCRDFKTQVPPNPDNPSGASRLHERVAVLLRQLMDTLKQSTASPESMDKNRVDRILNDLLLSVVDLSRILASRRVSGAPVVRKAVPFNIVEFLDAQKELLACGISQILYAMKNSDFGSKFQECSADVCNLVAQIVSECNKSLENEPLQIVKTQCPNILANLAQYSNEIKRLAALFQTGSDPGENIKNLAAAAYGIAKNTKNLVNLFSKSNGK